MVESRDLDLRDLEQLSTAEKELKQASLDQSATLQELSDLRHKLAALQSDQRIVEQDIQIEDMRKHILERLKSLKEQILKQKQTLNDQGQQKVQKDLGEQIQTMQRYLAQVEMLEKNTVGNIQTDLQRKIKECDEEYCKTKQDLVMANQAKQTYILKLKEQIEN